MKVAHYPNLVTGRVYCEKCEKSFDFEKHVTVTFTTKQT